ncbi:ATP-dependent DNA helicase RecG [Alphaproteobacteria bacterium]|nr:ATP-dependent DNA helicase RecG [Alphaproteobacteria bacterium]
MHPRRPSEIFGLFAATTALPGVGSKLAAIIEKRIGAHVIDVLRHLPVGLIDRSARPPLSDITDGCIATFDVLVVKHDKTPPGTRRPWRVICENETGDLDIIFFHVRDDYVSRMLPAGERRIVSGRVEIRQDRVQMAHPDHIIKPEDAASMPVIEPVYPLTAGLSPKALRRAIEGALKRLSALPEWIPATIMAERKWPDFTAAMIEVHHPKTSDDLFPASPARARLAFDELLANQLALSLMRHSASISMPGRVFSGDGKLVRDLQAALPFSLTGAQIRSIAEIKTDQTSDKRMLRMLQGDVGSGKTLVALFAMLHAVEAGAQAALLAPTEVLARQHHETINRFLAPLGREAKLLLGQGRHVQERQAQGNAEGRKTGQKAGRKAVIDDLASGDAQIVVGTHALISDNVHFANLGLAVVDEQHRFGVRQRILLGQKGTGVDVIVMTATPIPRSLAMTAYGDLDHSRLDEKPAGRLPIDTRALPLDRLGDVVDRLRAALANGKRAYWICPLVEESEKLDVAAAEERFAALARVLPDCTIALAHGKMKAGERDAQMQRFRDGEAQLLIATTVVEVGVDVPEASVIIIEHAERFGLAQLHQLRGRVGRSDVQSSCLLLYQGPLSDTAAQRLKVMRETNDGFVIAERDLQLRGPGEFLGQRQSGAPEFVLADLGAHQDLIAPARECAKQMIGDDNKPLDQNQVDLLLSLFERDSAVRFLASG